MERGEISDFISLSGLSLVSKDDYYTFNSLAAAPEYSIAGQPYLGATATQTFAGKPWEIFRANGLVYDYFTDAVVPIASILERIDLSKADKFYLSNGLILPGSLYGSDRVKNYTGWFKGSRLNFYYSEVDFD